MSRFLSVKVILYCFILLLIDMCLVPRLGVGTFRPAFLYLLIPYVTFEWHWKKALPAAIAVGLLRDIVSSQAFGVETVALVAAAFVLMRVAQKIERELFLMRFVTTFVFVLGASFLTWILAALIQEAPKAIPIWTVLSVSFGSALATAVVMPIFFFVTSGWFRDEQYAKQYELFG